MTNSKKERLDSSSNKSIKSSRSEQVDSKMNILKDL